MASNSVILKGATWNGVSSLEVPTSGGGTALFTDVSDTTAAAADVAQGKYFYNSLGAYTEGTASGGGGGGGASNVAFGSFTTAATDGAQLVTVPYSGSGYPIIVLVFCPDGTAKPQAITNEMTLFAIAKTDMTVAPVYTGDSTYDRYAFMTVYRGSNTYSGQVNYNGFATIANGSDALETYSSSTLRLKSDTEISVYVKGESYGFSPNTEFNYMVVYSE